MRVGCTLRRVTRKARGWALGQVFSHIDIPCQHCCALIVFATRGVSAIAFTFDSRYLFCISCDDHNMMCMFELATASLVLEFPCQHGTPPRILQITCSPGLMHDGNQVASNAQYESIVTVGKSHVKFWRFRRYYWQDFSAQYNSTPDVKVVRQGVASKPQPTR